MTYNLKEDKFKTKQIGQFIRPGKNELKINNIETRISESTGSVKITLDCETRPIKIEHWQGLDGAEGQVGKIGILSGIYLNNDELKNKALKQLKAIVIAMGKENELDNVKETDNFNDLIEDVKKIVCDGTYIRCFISGEEYEKQDNSGWGLKLSLKLPFYACIEAIDIPENVSKLPLFDRNNPFHYKSLSKEVKEKYRKV